MLVPPLVEVEEEIPRGTRLVVVIPAREHRSKAAEVHVTRMSTLDRPRQAPSHTP